MKHLNEALSKSMIKKLEKRKEKYYAIVPLDELYNRLNEKYTKYSIKCAINLEAFILPFDKIMEIIKGKIPPSSYTIYEPKFDYKTKEDIVKKIHNLDYLEDTSFFERVYKKWIDGNITINKYNW